VKRYRIFLLFVVLVFMIGIFTPACLANGFIMEQDSATSGGLVQRQIDVSSPASGAYLYENMTVVGFAEITETFTMGNIPPGSSGSRMDDFFGTGSGNIFNTDQSESPAPLPALNSDSSITENSGMPGSAVLGATAESSLDPDDIVETGRLLIAGWFDLF
jgi:hypothetical protein